MNIIGQRTRFGGKKSPVHATYGLGLALGHVKNNSSTRGSVPKPKRKASSITGEEPEEKKLREEETGEKLDLTSYIDSLSTLLNIPVDDPPVKESEVINTWEGAVEEAGNDFGFGGMDLTNLSPEEIFLLTTPGDELCGSMLSWELDELDEWEIPPWLFEIDWDTVEFN